MREFEHQLREADVSHATDVAFARLVMTLSNSPSDALFMGAVLASAAVQNGDVCFTLGPSASAPGVDFPDVALWRKALLESGVVQQDAGPVTQPLVLDAANRLYLARYWAEEGQLAGALRARLIPGRELSGSSLSLLDTLFPTTTGAEPDWQRVAAVVAARQRLSVITGGPGTGKTRTVARLLALLQSEAGTTPLRIALLAPTGKAAARLLESLQGEEPGLLAQGIDVSLPSEAATLHRQLGYRHGRRDFWHNAENPLPFDVVLVDEASMIDLSMMCRLVEALQVDTRLIMLGDRDQLASVEAGNVLGDIVGAASPADYSATQKAALRQSCPGFELAGSDSGVPGMADSIVQLRHSYRFDSSSGIGQFAAAVNAGDADAALAVGDRFSDTSFVEPANVPLQQHLTLRALPAARDVLSCESVSEALMALQQFRVLCAMRGGPRGVDQINEFMVTSLVRSNLVAPGQQWYRGRPILITRNDQTTQLYNGDTGLLWPDEDNNMVAWFSDGQQGVRAVAPGRLPSHQTCYAMTVHKTQGSEFRDVLMVLPEPPNPLLSRDLLYTGVTRARESVEIYCSEDAIRAGCASARVRESGLRERLWGIEE